MASSQTDAFLIALVDQPMIPAEIISSLVIVHADGDNSRITVPVYDGKYGHPIIVHRDYEPEIMEISEAASDGLRGFINRHRNEITEVEVDSPTILEDIDTPADYEKYAKPLEPVYEYHKWHP